VTRSGVRDELRQECEIDAIQVHGGAFVQKRVVLRSFPART
jgi:hypothetical protein